MGLAFHGIILDMIGKVAMGLIGSGSGWGPGDAAASSTISSSAEFVVEDASSSDELGQKSGSETDITCAFFCYLGFTLGVQVTYQKT